MNLQTLLPFLLAMTPATILATKYAVQITKPIVKSWFKSADIQNSVVQIYVVLFGAAAETGAALALAPTFKQVFTWTALSVAASCVFGAAAGLAAIGDYHLLDSLRGIGSSPAPPAA